MRDDQYVLNHCTVYLARSNVDERHNFGYGHYADGDPRGRIREAWRFPVVDACAAPPPGLQAADLNDVTFVYPRERRARRPSPSSGRSRACMSRSRCAWCGFSAKTRRISPSP